MAGRTRKGTMDHDGDGKMGGSLPANISAAVEALAKANEALTARVMELEAAMALGDPIAAARHLKKD